jgi:beta-N-acetylhexosaminidase
VGGLQMAGVAATVKHFPGHGNPDVDSHLALPVLTQSATSLAAVDLPPFRAAIASSVDLVMVGHLSVPALDGTYPASLSPAIVTGLLRGRLGYRGVVVTDALGMGALRDRYGAGQSAVLAVAAGDDLLGMPANTVQADEAIVAAVTSGRLPRATVAAAATRVMRLRLQLGAAAHPAAVSTVGSPANLSVAASAAAASITDVGPSCAAPHLTAVTLTGTDQTAIRRLSAALTARGVQVGAGPVVNVIGGEDFTNAAAAAQVTVSAGTPYPLASSPAPVRLSAYGDDPAAMAALADVLSGRAAARGRLPVPVGLTRPCG